MTTRNFRVHNGLEVGDMTFNASTNAMTGIDAVTLSTTTAPTANGELANKKYVDDGLAGLSQTSISSGTTNVTVSGTAAVVTAAGNTELTINDTSATFNGNVVVTGNFTVNGTTTTVATTNTTNTDNLYELGTGTSGSPANDAGICIERGSADNAFIGFDESEDKFKMGTGSFTGASTGNLTIATGTLVANLEGTATAAQYSDVAERFASNEVLAPGTVVALGGAEEICKVNEEGSDEVFGVVSSLDQAAFKMNGGAGNDDTHPYIAMTGRVDVKVIGTVNKGDRLISASVPGYAKAAIKSECTAFNVIGRSLTSKTTAGPGSVLAAVRTSH
tara:strand:- start:1097 stop:2092 length:996 start_codon:yes stop_codon:yes gene_type:complete